MILAPLSSLALVNHFMVTGWFSAALLPIIRAKSVFFKSTTWLVMAPRPNEGDSPATVEECQIRAWVSKNTRPRDRINLDNK